MKVFNKRMQNKTFVVVTDNIIEKKKNYPKMAAILRYIGRDRNTLHIMVK